MSVGTALSRCKRTRSHDRSSKHTPIHLLHLAPIPASTLNLFIRRRYPRLDESLKEEEEHDDEIEEEEESVLLSDFHDVLLELASSPDDMACFTITSAVGGAHLPTAFSLEELSPEECRDLSAVCFPVNGRCVHSTFLIFLNPNKAGGGGGGAIMAIMAPPSTIFPIARELAQLLKEFF